MIVIGLSGKKLSGKDTVFMLLKESMINLTIERVAFADALKQEVAELLKVDVATIEQQKSRFRGILQWYGTDWRRADDENYWIKRAQEKINALAGTSDVVVVTDVRFPNEAELVRSNDGLLVRINRQGPSTDTHSSETAMDGYTPDLVIDNTGTLDALKANVSLLAKIIQLSSFKKAA